MKIIIFIFKKVSKKVGKFDLTKRQDLKKVMKDFILTAMEQKPAVKKTWCWLGVVVLGQSQ